jgi:hypothetical protein
VHGKVEEGMKKQRAIDKEERDAYFTFKLEELIADKIRTANASVRALISALAEISDLAHKYPAHPKIGGFAARLDTLVAVVQQFSKHIK